ncbi:hypothetical protein LE127_16820, partial [Escherichia coli]|nr:hypothetical protein [Escherichia coli]MCA7844303.1 hypothetical protein [Escherichia coli]
QPSEITKYRTNWKNKNPNYTSQGHASLKLEIARANKFYNVRYPTGGHKGKNCQPNFSKVI